MVTNAVKLHEIISDTQGKNDKVSITHAMKDNPLPTEKELDFYFDEVFGKGTMGKLWLRTSLCDPTCIRFNDVKKQYEINPDADPIRFKDNPKTSEWGDGHFCNFFEYNDDAIQWRVKEEFAEEADGVG